jgi:hypothetical protein
MKKLILTLAIALIGMIIFAQSDYTYTLTTVNDASGTLWNYADTLEDGQTLDAIIRVKSPTVMDLSFQIVSDEITGTGTYTATIYGSNDNSTFVAVADSTVSISAALTADGSIWVKANDWNYSYVKLLMTSTGTETSRHKLWYSFRKE